MLKFQAVRGTKDILPVDALAFQNLEAHSRALFERFGFGEIRTPTFESLGLFQRSLGETTDVVQKEMYVFEDRGGRTLALRPEGTAGVVRAFIEHHLSQTTPFCKLFYIGPMFRAERPQAGRYREFWQIGGEYFGNAAPAADAEMLILLSELFSRLVLPDVRLKVNSLGDSLCRPVYLQALKTYLEGKTPELCDDCRRRMEKNPLRVLDCKTDGPKLVDVPTVDAFWCDPCRTHFEQVQAFLRADKIPFELTPRLVRGLDYYTRTVFEVTSSALGAQNALAAGGRYDALVKEMGGPDTPALGFAMGVERAIEAVRAASVGGKITARPVKVFVAAMGAAAVPEAFQLLESLRLSDPLAEKGVRFEGGFFEKKLGQQLTMADRLGCSHCLIVGDDEIKNGQVTVKTLRTSTQESLAKDALIRHLMDLSA